MACAENLIRRGDGIGVDEIIDMMASGQVAWEEGIQILNKNRDCTSETIRDVVQWNDLETREDQYIELMERLAKSFHPPMARQARAAKDWKRAITLQQSQEVVEITAISYNASGLIVPFGWILGQVPLSELDTRHHDLAGSRNTVLKQLAAMVNSQIKVVVLESDRGRNHLVLSEKRAKDKLADSFLAGIKPGSVLEGKVIKVSNFGIFVDLGDIDGLIHMSELSWDKSQGASHIPSIGSRIEVYVMEIDQEQKRVRLSLRRLFPDFVIERYVTGQRVKALVTGIINSGAFVTVEEEVDGFIHVSELAAGTITHPQQVVHEGQSLVLRVLHVDKEKHRLELSLRQLHDKDLYWRSIRIKT